MIKVSKLADYAVVALATLAQSDAAQMTAGGISLKTGLPEPTVAKVLKLLAKDSIVQSIRGVNGGYKLAMSPEAISVAKIVSAVDGPITLTACVDGSSEVCGYQGKCSVKGRWNNVNHAIRGALESVKLSDMIVTGCASNNESVIEMAAGMES